MINDDFIICVATNEEKEALVPKEYWDYTIITGIGIGNVLKSLHAINKFNIKNIINIGYAGAKGIEKGTTCFVDICLTYQEHDLNQFSYLLTLPKTKLPIYNCYTSTDFVTSSKLEEPFLVDMELLAYTALPLYANVYSIKCVSDNMNLDDYNNSLQKDFTGDVKKALIDIGVE